MTQAFIALGANLPSARFGSPRQTLEAAIDALQAHAMTVTGRSRWYESAPVPMSDQPWFVNGVIRVATDLDADALLAVLHDTEAAFGRVRRTRWEARVVDLDLVAYGRLVRRTGSGLALPHPRMHERRFVLQPMADIDPGWRHPVLGKTVEDLLGALDTDAVVRPLEE
ncbi:MAG: 2-amino-4-hydroxy-6-hydroxymethyldihydropteridine diphosphokinase [Alphaproteobacteria bacterium]|nr:MAG: 2-amino-4-hydroxy-6-hydroxymethyldihydropteridine diphosphokinase [Alphaproteobacteria bacterium]